MSAQFSESLCDLVKTEITERVEKLVEKRLNDVMERQDALERRLQERMQLELDARVKACVKEALNKQSYV